LAPPFLSRKEKVGGRQQKSQRKDAREANPFLLVFPFLFRKEKGSEARTFLLAPPFLSRKEKVGKTTNKSQRKDAREARSFLLVLPFLFRKEKVGFWPHLFFLAKKR